MPPPTDRDRHWTGRTARELLEDDSGGRIRARASLEAVRAAVASTSYPEERVQLIKGRVEDTIPHRAPERIALLRLDTDWYESTTHELEHLYPRLVRGGVIVIDDYGCWQGARDATDEFIRRNNVTLLLNRMDYTGRIGVKIC